MHLLTIFSIENDGYRFLDGPLNLLVMVPMVVAVTFGARRLFPDPRVMIGSILAFALAGLMTFMAAVSIVAKVRDHGKLLRQMDDGRFSVAEGEISRLSIGRYKGGRHPEVSFDVGGERFRISDFGANMGFNYARFRRSGLAEGHYVRISHSGEIIMRLEVRQP